MIAESEAFDYLDAPIVRLGGAETPIPYNPELEKAAVPQVPDIVAAARELVRREVAEPCRSKSSCRRSTWTWRPDRSRAGTSRKATAVKKGDAAVRDRDRQGGDGSRSAGQRHAARHHRAAGVDIPVGSAVAWIYAEGEAYAGGAAGSAAARPRATPLARRLARRLNLDLAKLAGSGPKGRIQARDIEPASAAAAPAPRQARQTALLQTAMRSSAKAGAHDTTALWLRRGEGVPVVLIHGFGAETAAWRPLLSAFDPEVPILSIDLPGHGAAVGAAAD